MSEPPSVELTTVDLRLDMPSAVTIGGTSDEFLCFSLDPGLTEDRYLQAMQIVPGNERIVHHVLIYVDTLHYLRRAGRVSAAAKLFGDALSVKPLLTVVNGEVEPFDKVVGRERALGKLVDKAVALAYGRNVDLAVEHFAAEKEGHELLQMLQKRIPHARDVVLTQVSAAIGANVGPGALAVTVSPF